MRSRARCYEVVVSVKGKPVARVVWAETLPLAVGIAERSEPPGRALSCRQEVDIIGRCERCQSIIQTGDKFRAVRNVLRCEDCR